MRKIILKCENVNFDYNINSFSKNLNLVIDNILNKKKKFENTHRVFHNLNLKLYEGQFLGLSGRNGSGKTTLLRILAGIYQPTSGIIHRKYKVMNPLINLNSGMIDSCNAIENIYLKCLYSGLDKNFFNENYKKIIDFADLKKFTNYPIRTYSSGMKFRLGLSIAISIPSDIIILDEWITVSDQNFRDRIYDTMNGFLKNSKALVMASNNLGMLKNKCTDILYLDELQN